MSAEGLIVTLTLIVIAILWVGSPLLRRRAGQQRKNKPGQRQRDRLLADYERVLSILRDLDEDHATGKTQPETYEQEREQWIQRGVQLLMALDKLEGEKKQDTPEAAPTVDESVDNAIEAAILARRKKVKSHVG